MQLCLEMCVIQSYESVDAECECATVPTLQPASNPTLLAQHFSGQNTAPGDQKNAN